MLHKQIQRIAKELSLDEKAKNWESMYCDKIKGSPKEDERDFTISKRVAFPILCKIGHYEELLAKIAREFVDRLNKYDDKIFKIEWYEPVRYENAILSHWNFELLARSKK